MSGVSARLAGERGVTLVELLAAMTVGLIVVSAALTFMDGSWRLQARTVDNLDATDRGRLAMDRIMQQLDGRVCLNAATPTVAAQGSLVTGASDSQIEFYASVTRDTAPRLVVERRRMTYRAATKDVLLEAWTGIAPPPTAPPANTTTPTRARVVATGVAPAGATAVFRYYALAGAPALPTGKLTAPITDAADRDSVVLVRVTFAALGRKPGVSTEFGNDSMTRSPTCLF
jgi:prepilin-type N-terminal cleavage/methylation domain-containing protein